MLNEEAEAKKFKVVLGRSVTELHGKCHKIQEQFLSHVNKTGLLSFVKTDSRKYRINQVIR